MNRLQKYGIDIYKWFWWHIEFWLEPEDRRPLTYIFRDWYHNYPLIIIIILSAFFYCLGRWWLPVSVGDFLIGFFCLLVGALLGHLFWGQPYIPDQRGIRDKINRRPDGS